MKPIVKIGGALIAVAMLFLVVFNPSSCNRSKRHNGQDPLVKKACKIRATSGNVLSGEPIQYIMTSDSEKLAIDSLLFLDDTPVAFGPIETNDLPLGRHIIKGTYTYADSSRCEATWSVEVRSDIQPEVLGYELVSMLDHDPAAYTQGLTWNNGRLYEGTGQYGESFLLNYDPQKLDYRDRIEMPLDVFGEGITILGDKLYQLSWKSKKGYVYDLESMELVSDFDTPMEEGWGLTDDGISLIMSDGSNMLYYMDPVTFEVTHKQAIYNSEGAERLINEMEYVNGYIYANIYGQTLIAQIEASSGKTVAYIDCRGILPPEFNTAEQDVFNGIAYDPSRKTFFVTGKYWSKMFEVRFVKKPFT